MKNFLALVILLFVCQTMFAQELDATVEVNYEQLPVAAKERLGNFRNQIRDYLSNTKFRQQAWEGGKIKCSFNILFSGASSDISYTAQLVITSQRTIEGTPRNSLMLTILDNSWQFNYEKNQSMNYNQSDFDPLTSFLDFYASIIIGFDLDSYYRLGGSDLFSKALEIAVKGGTSKYAKGWQSESATYNRRVLVDNLMNAKYQQFRSDYFDHHYNGLDLFYSDDKEYAMKNIAKIVYNIAKVKDQIDPRSVLMKVFFDAKAGEFAEYLKEFPDQNIFNVLKKIDPPHTAKYETAIEPE